MAVVTISTASGFDFDDLDFPDLTTGTTVTKTATTWRVTQTPATTYDEYTGKGLVYASVGGDSVPNGGTITGFKHVEGGVTQFQATKLSISGVDYKTAFDGDDFGDFLAAVLQGNDTITGGKGDDHLLGFGGNDMIDGKAGNDTMEGGTGNDVYIVDKAGDVVIEGGSGGIDTIKSSIAVDLTSAPFVGEEIENVILTAANAANVTGNQLANTITGGSGINILLGLEGDDVLHGLGGNDTLLGGDDNDVLDGGLGNDKMEGGFGNNVYIVDSKGDSIVDVDGEDTVQSKLSIDLSALAGGEIENAVLTGTGAANAIGTGENNKLTGNDGANTLNGKAGADTMIGGKGADTYVVDDAGDVVTESLAGAPGGKDLVQSAITFELGANVESLLLTGLLNIDGKGNALANLITGNDGNNRLDGLGGNDTLSGGKGNDTYVVDSVADKITETLTLAKNGGTDTVETSVTYSLAALANVENLTLTGSANINGTGNATANVISGNDGNNKLDGGAGNDTLKGGAGDDTYVATTNDVIVEAAGGGTDTILMKAAPNIQINLAAQYANVENVTWSGNQSFGVNGSSAANVLIGDTGQDFLDGGAGNDKLVGNAASDWLMGGLGDDLLNGGAGNDTVSFTAGEGEDLIAAGTYNTGDWIKLQGTDIYDLNWDWDNAGNLYISEAIDGDYDFDDTGFIRVENFFGGTGALEVQFDTKNYDEFYGTASTGAHATFQRGLIGTNNAFHTEIIVGQAGNDQINGKGGYYDLIFGGDGNDTITGGSGGYDFLRGGNGNDVINGLGGGDDLRGEAGYDTLNGGDGFDRADYRNASFGVTVNLRFSMALDDGTGTEPGKGTTDFFFSIEDVRGSNFGDDITGNDGENYLYGLSGDDTLSGGGGFDGFFLGDGSDTIRYDRFYDGGDFIQDWNGEEDKIAFASHLDSGNDGILNDLQSIVLSVSDVIDGNGSNNVIVTFHNGATWTFVGIGNGTIDTLGELFNNPASQLGTYDDKEVFGFGIHYLQGGDGNDLIHGNTGNDTVNGGLGDDVLNPGADANGSDVVEFEVGDGKDTMMTYGAGDVIALLGADFYDINFEWHDRSLYIAQAIDGDYDFDDTGYVKLANFFTGTGSINVTIDTAAYNTLYGTDANLSTFTFQRGLAGINNLTTAEVIIGTAGNDKINGNGGFYDALYGDLGNDTITGGAGTDFIRAGGDNDVVNGLGGNDTLRGDWGNDTLNGGDGNDRADYRNADAGVLVNLAVGLAATDGGGGFFDVDKLISIEDVRGSDHDDVITGSTVANVLQGRAGDDVLTGAGGDDTMNGGDGKDTFHFNAFGEGNAVIEDWKGSDDFLTFAVTLDAGGNGILDDLEAAIFKIADLGAGNDVVVTFDNGKTLTFTGAGTGTIDEITDLVGDPGQIGVRVDATKTGGAGNDNLTGTEHNDVLTGLAGNDTLTGGEGNDILDGGLGNDTYIVTNDGGFDTIAAGTYNTGDLIKIAGADFYDISYGWNHGNLEIAAAVDSDYDFLETGNVTIANFFGGTGSIKVQIDTVGFNLDYGTDANLATFTFQRGLVGTNNATSAEVIIGTVGNDKIDGKGGYYDALYGDDGNDTITGGGGSDWLRGGDGNDVMTGAGGNDRLRGEAGNDTLNGGDGIDRADYRLAGGEVNVDLNLGIASDDGHGTIDTLIGIENVRGGDFDDRITGNVGANLLEGRDGADVLTGAGGSDTLNGGGGADTFRFNGFGEGHDVIEDWAGAEDILSFSDLLDTGAAGILDDLQAAIADVDDGGAGADVVVTFDNGSTLTFQGAGTGAITDITQLVTDPNTQITSF